jgi:hypothetical protein
MDNDTLVETSRLVEATLALEQVSIDYRVKMRPHEAIQFVARAPAYNNFAEGDLIELVNAIGDSVPPMMFGDLDGSPNPNNGKPHHVFYVGNEGSRVIYLEVYTAYFDTFRPGPDSSWQAPPTFDGLRARLRLLAKRAHADEFTATETDGSWEFRFWWD